MSITEPPVPLPLDIADLVRPLPAPLGVDQETLPPRPGTPPEVKAIKAALVKLAALPKATSSFAIPGDVMHGLPSVPLDADGFAVSYPYEASAITATKLAGAKKQKAKSVLLSAVELQLGALQQEEIAAAIKLSSPDAVLLVKVGGKLYPHDTESSAAVVALHLLGKTEIQAKVIDLDKVPKPKKPKASSTAPTLPPPPPDAEPPKPIGADTILGTLIGGAKGSNAGGIYRGTDGVERYVKFYTDPAQAHCEHLANSIYSALGHGAPKSVLFEHNGVTAYASEIVGGKTLADAGLTKDRAQAFMKGFIADVLTGNWDAVGTGHDNAFVLDSGEIVRIDNGGTFLMRAKAGRKPSSLLTKITEWDVFFSDTNPYYQSLAKKAGAPTAEDVDGLADQIRAVLDVRAGFGSWEAYVRRIVPSMPAGDRDLVVGMLEARTKLLADKLAEITAPKPVRTSPDWPGRYVEKQKSAIKPRAGLALADLPEHDPPEFYGKHKADEMPSGEKRKSYEARARTAIAKASTAARMAITAFTGSYYSDIREAECKTDGELRDAGWSAAKIADYRAKSDAIRSAYEAVDHEPGTVYRGIQNLNPEVVRLFLEGEEFALGAQGRQGTTSSSWKADVAINSFMGGTGDGSRGTYKILFIFRQKTGIAIETISSFDTEHEVLLRRDARFRTTGLSRLRGTERVLIVEAEEIDP